MKAADPEVIGGHGNSIGACSEYGAYITRIGCRLESNSLWLTCEDQRGCGGRVHRAQALSTIYR